MAKSNRKPKDIEAYDEAPLAMAALIALSEVLMGKGGKIKWTLKVRRWKENFDDEKGAAIVVGGTFRNRKQADFRSQSMSIKRG